MGLPGMAAYYFCIKAKLLNLSSFLPKNLCRTRALLCKDEDKSAVHCIRNRHAFLSIIWMAFAGAQSLLSSVCLLERAASISACPRPQPRPGTGGAGDVPGSAALVSRGGSCEPVLRATANRSEGVFPR